ncbi:MAG: hypothetical protein WCP39_05155 [Chlamydiota bacterium]
MSSSINLYQQRILEQISASEILQNECELVREDTKNALNDLLPNTYISRHLLKKIAHRRREFLKSQETLNYPSIAGIQYLQLKDKTYLCKLDILNEGHTKTFRLCLDFFSMKKMALLCEKSTGSMLRERSKRKAIQETCEKERIPFNFGLPDPIYSTENLLIDPFFEMDGGKFIKTKTEEKFLLLPKVITSLLLHLEPMSKIGIVHCDIKPENILIHPISTQPIVRVQTVFTDWDPSFFLSDEQEKNKAYGSLMYLAPEIFYVLIKAGPSLPFSNFNTPARDIWALGLTSAIFCNMLDPKFESGAKYSQKESVILPITFQNKLQNFLYQFKTIDKDYKNSKDKYPFLLDITTGPFWLTPDDCKKSPEKHPLTKEDLQKTPHDISWLLFHMLRPDFQQRITHMEIAKALPFTQFMDKPLLATN